MRTSRRAQLHVVIPVLNGWNTTRRCLEALRASSHCDFTVIVVDHGSTDATKATLAADYPEVVHVLGDSSLWWAGATNLGLRVAMERGADTVMLLNNDCYVRSDTIQRLMAHRQRLGEALVAPIQYDADSDRPIAITVKHCFLLGFPTLCPARPRLPSHLASRTLLPTALIAGGRGVLIPTSVLHRVGLLDADHLPHYGADHDFYLRCQEHRIPLYTALDAAVAVDNDKTSLAARPERLPLKAFGRTLIDRRSHRNVSDLAVLFKRYYPLKGLHTLGLVLYLARYCVVYAGKRALYLMTKRRVGHRRERYEAPPYGQ